MIKAYAVMLPLCLVRPLSEIATCREEVSDTAVSEEIFEPQPTVGWKDEKKKHVRGTKMDWTNPTSPEAAIRKSAAASGIRHPATLEVEIETRKHKITSHPEI